MYKDPKDEEERNPTATSSRWQTISHDVSKFCGCYEKLKATNPSEAPADTIYTVMLKKLIELKQERGEFSVNSDFECECLASAVRDNKGGIEVHRWCKDLLEKKIPRSADDESPALRNAVRALRRVFPKSCEESTEEAMLYMSVRQTLIDSGLDYLMFIRKKLHWDMELSEERVTAKVMSEYKEWKALQKEEKLHVLRQNLMDMWKGRGFSEEDAIIKQRWRELKSSAQTKRKAPPGPRDEAGKCTDFKRLRGTLAARWKINRRRKKKKQMEEQAKSIGLQVVTGETNGLPDTTEAMVARVKRSYMDWKRGAKDGILARLRKNLKDTLMKEYKLTESEAITAGGLNDAIYDTSDEEDS
ncbi:hypothetical protein R1sor_022113 [Riccia sorocarpa]|uniref:Uncharacterized protein n=1 Tax=Riccia sorocarpa TaxID=122646 RepID=A0ABD3GIX0_9MARC